MTALLQLVMTSSDFRRLVKYDGPWSPQIMARIAAPNLLENLDAPGSTATAQPHWTRAYWLGPDYAAVMLARAYLESARHGCELLWDNGADPAPGYLLLTDYIP